jgi:septal ring factor EnvC (AmiA/AmiB activator)
MQYQHIKIIKDGATMPTEAEVNAKIQELKDAETQKETDASTGKQKLKDLGLNDAEIKALIGV